MARTTVVYLGGFGRSGSTLVERILGSATGWVNIGELVDLARSVAPRDELCGCGVRFSECELWTQVGEVAFGGWTPGVFERLARLQRDVARQRHLPRLLAARPPATGDLAEFHEAFSRIYAAVAQVSGCEVVVDASKGPAFGRALAMAPEVDLRMLNVVRDPRAVAWSWSRTVERPHTSAASADEMWRIPPHRSAAQWSALQGEMHAIALRQRDFARLRYEDFVADPLQALVAATAELGVLLEPGDLPSLDDGRIVLEPSHGLSGNPGRFRSGSVELRPDQRWVTAMPAKDRRVVTALTLPLLRAYGYRIARPEHASSASSASSGSSGSPEHPPTDPHRAQPSPVDRTHPVSQPGPKHAAAGGHPLVSAVIPTRGRPELLRETLATIVAQDYPGELEILVVHDREEMDLSLQELSRPGRQILPMVNSRTPGLSGGRNSGLLASQGTFVASCDDDDLWHPAKVSRQVEMLLADPALLSVGAGIRLLMGGDRGNVDWPAREAVVSHERLLQNRVKELHSSTLMTRRSAFDVVGLYDEELPFGYGEDWDWLLRASKAGKVGAVTEILADIRKDIPSWFRDRSLNTATALEYLLAKHPDLADARRGHARILGQIAAARAAAGERKQGAKIAFRALGRYPAAPHAWLALAVAGPGIEPRRLLTAARRLGRGLS